jgi:uncharacterized protein YgbK (DUF1537 family)
MKCAVGLVALKSVRAGAASLAETIRARQEAVLVVDAVVDEDLLTIADAASEVGVSELASGSAGLADAIAGTIADQRILAPESRTSTSAPANNPVLVVAASRNPVTSKQISYALQRAELVLVSLDAKRFAADASGEVGRVVDSASDHLSNGRDVALSAVDSSFVAGLSSDLAAALGKLSSRLVEHCKLAGFVLTGGDTALAVCRALRAESLTLLAEVAPGIPLGRMHGGQGSGMLLVTKAGGFGQEDAIVRAITQIHGARLA